MRSFSGAQSPLWKGPTPRYLAAYEVVTRQIGAHSLFFRLFDSGRTLLSLFVPCFPFPLFVK
jgi:hypothetical protein